MNDSSDASDAEVELALDGPSIEVERHWHDDSKLAIAIDDHYALGCAVALAGLLITLALHHKANEKLREGTAFSAKRLLYQCILRLAPALAALNFLAVTSPPMHRTISLLQHVVVAGCMACFMELLLLLLYRTSVAPEGSDEAHLPAITNIVEQLEKSFEEYHQADGHYLITVMALLRQQEPIAIWTSPPIGCCFALCPCSPCARTQPPTLCLVWMLRRAVLVYVLGAIVAPFLEMWFEGVPALDEYHVAVEWCAWVLETAAMLLALYSLFIMYRLSYEPLSHYQTTLKFAAIKLIMWVFTLQRITLVSFLGGVGLWWQHVAIVVECPALSLLLTAAFPPNELPTKASQRASQEAELSEDEEPSPQRTSEDLELDRLL